MTRISKQSDRVGHSKQGGCREGTKRKQNAHAMRVRSRFFRGDECEPPCVHRVFLFGNVKRYFFYGMFLDNVNNRLEFKIVGEGNRIGGGLKTIGGHMLRQLKCMGTSG